MASSIKRSSNLLISLVLISLKYSCTMSSSKGGFIRPLLLRLELEILSIIIVINSKQTNTVMLLNYYVCTALKYQDFCRLLHKTFRVLILHLKNNFSYSHIRSDIYFSSNFCEVLKYQF